MKSAGQKLREERLRRGLDLEAIASDLRISSRYLKAIESGDWGQLPEGFFGRSFVRQYALALGLDPADLEDDLKSLGGQPPEGALKEPPPSTMTSIHVPPLPVASRGRNSVSKWLLSVAMLVAVIGCCAYLYEGWQRYRTIQELAKAQEAAKPQPATPPQGKAGAPAAGQGVSPQPGSEGAPPAGITAVSTIETAPGGTTLEISAVETTWLEITSDGRRVFSGLLEPGQIRQFPGVQAARLLIGNAGGVSVRRKGQDIGPIGPRGQVRVVNLSEESFEIQAPRKPQSD